MRANLLGFLFVFAIAPVTSGSEPPDTTGHRVLVTGAVRYPGRATLTDSTMTVPDALAAVGSPTANAGDEVTVIHPANPGGTPERRTINLKDMEMGKPGIDVTLQDGDIVNVPEGKRFYISGSVRNPGVYRLPAGTTVSQAIIAVGGLADGGTDRRLKIRRVVNGKSVEVSARLDDEVLPNDEIKVGRTMF